MVRRKAETEQVNVRLSTETVERIDAVIATFGRRSRNQVCAEIIETYLPFWEELQHEQQQILDRQRAYLSGQAATTTTTAAVTRTKRRA